MFFNQIVNCSTSTIKIGSKEAAEMAQKTLDWIKNRREKAKANAIEAERQRINNGFWHKLFRMKEATVEDAEESLSYDHWNFNYHWNDLIGAKNEAVAQRILNASKYADEIMISTEELSLIS